ncbi:MAG: hypothetical protein ACOVOV_06155 [Dolichospermum sp.]
MENTADIFINLFGANVINGKFVPARNDLAVHQTIRGFGGRIDGNSIQFPDNSSVIWESEDWNYM